jgi:hypothetical protein
LPWRSVRQTGRSFVPRGAVVATVVVTGAYRLGTARGDMAEVDDQVPGSPRLEAVEIDRFGDFSAGRWAWRLDQVELLRPPVVRGGQQGWFTVVLD